MEDERKNIKVTWSDCLKYEGLFHITYRKMHEKFYPHFCGREEDVKQEMLIELIKIIKRIKNGEVRKSAPNLVITALKYKCYDLARKYIDEDRTKKYLEDIKLKDRGYEITWEDLIPGSLITYEGLFSHFTKYEEQYMVRIILGERGYTKYKLRNEIKRGWDYMAELENRVREEIAELIKRRCGNG
jgi:hypothetical protein